uniref:DUF8206 domain-containing protein n=1 Tax=Panagrolaimus superbus TaxID=310955 RepID=A0A914YER8_9BILA
MYTTVCHDECYIPYSDPTQKHDPNLKRCCAFWEGVCRHCGCNLNQHIRIFYRRRVITKHLEAQAVQNALTSEIDASKFKRQMIRRCQQMIDGYTKEMNFVLFATANFSTFLIQHGISQKSDIFEKYLENAVENEKKMLRSVQNCDNKKRDRMVSLLKSYQDTRNGIIENKSSIPISLIEIQDIRQKLFSMPLTGTKIAEIFDIHVEVYNNEHAGNVTKCDSKSTISRCIDWTKNTVSSIFERRQK